MMKKFFFTILCSFFAVACAGQTTKNSVADSIRNFYQVAYYSQVFNIALDTIANPLLFETADEWVGTRYAYGGGDMDGIDCSHFSALLYNMGYGCRLGASAHAIHRSVNQRLSQKELREGDLVFFKIGTSKIVSHVGVYLGGNKFVHATTQAGVILSTLSEPYYKKYFVGGGRMYHFNIHKKKITSFDVN